MLPKENSARQKININHVPGVHYNSLRYPTHLIWHTGHHDFSTLQAISYVLKQAAL